jgi:F-type H+-transporting ATPase subunit b
MMLNTLFLRATPAWVLAALPTLAQTHGVEHAPAAGDPHAGEAAHEVVGALPSASQGAVTGITAIVVFGAVFAVLALKVWPTIAKGLDDRANKIRDEIRSAEQARKQAREALEQYEQSLKEARMEAQKMLDKARAQQQVMLDEMKAKNEVEIVQMREKARKDIDAAKKEALAELYGTASELAASAASKILRREVSAGDTRRLMDETMGQLAGTR